MLQYLLTTRSSTASSGGTDHDEQQSLLTLRFGAPQTVGGSTLYALDATTWSVDSGLAPATAAQVRWKYLGTSDGAIVGSVDGQQLQTVYGADGTAVHGFFETFDPNVAVPTLDARALDTNGLDVVQATYSKSDGGCQVAASVEFCSDSSSTFSQLEYFADGIGPAGASGASGLSSTSGGFYSVSSSETHIDYLGGTPTAADGVARPSKPYAFAANLPAARPALSAAAAFGGKLYVFGGSGTSTPSGVAIYDPASDSWAEVAEAPLQQQPPSGTTPGPTSPVDLSGWRAHTFGADTIALVKQGEPTYMFQPSTGRWNYDGGDHYTPAYRSAAPRYVPLGLLFAIDDDSAGWVDASGQPQLVATTLSVTFGGGTATTIQVFMLGAADADWRLIRTVDSGSARQLATVVIGDQLIMLLDDQSLLVCPLADNAADCSRGIGAITSVQPFPKYNAIASNGRVAIFGNALADDAAATNGVVAIDPQTLAVAPLGTLFGSRQGGIAVPVGDQVLLLGGTSQQGKGALGIETWRP